ncbi:MAG: hypothetical protein K2I79_03195, partial [Clostridia bacterium]|nr:hypothetical protein [Clostridia bacterium]
AMKMMFATMLKNMKADIPRATAVDSEALVQKVIQGLIPTIQQIIPQALQQYIPQSAGNNIAAIPCAEVETAQDNYVKPVNKKEKAKVVKVELQSEVKQENVDLTKAVAADIDGDSDEEYTDEEWDFDDDEWVEQDTEADSKSGVKRVAVSFRQRLKFSSDKNRDYYADIKNAFCAQRNVAYRVCGSVEKIKFHNELIAVIGVAKRSLKLWLALDPAQFDVER